MSDIVPSIRARTPAPYVPRRPEAAGLAQDDSLDLRRIVSLLVKKKWQILLVMSLVVAPAGIATYLAERLYRSSVLIQIDPQPVQVLPYQDFNLTNAPHYDTYMKTQEQVLRGPTLVSRVAKRLSSGTESPALQSELHMLGGRFSIQMIENTQMFRLSYVAPDPEVATKVANLFAEEYIKQDFESRQQTRERARQLLKRELESLEQRVHVSEKELVEYAQTFGIPTTDAGQSDLVQQKLALLGKQVADAEGDVVLARARLDAMQNASVANFPEQLVTDVIRGLVATSMQLEQSLTTLRASYGENWPALIQKRNELALVREQLVRAKTAALEGARLQAVMEYRAAESKQKAFTSALREQEQLANQLQNASIQFNIIRREVETNQKLYEGLLERLKQTGVTLGMEFGNIHIVEPALPSDVVDSPRIAWNLMLATILGLALGICVTLGRDYWANSMTTVEEVEQAIALPVLSAVPLMDRPARVVRGGGPLLGLLARTRAAALAPPSDAQSARQGARRMAPDQILAGAEAVRTLCASILLSRSDHPPRVLAVTSALPREGKTTIASQLGRAFADSGARTLLVECDMRRPTFGSVFRVGTEGGLSLFLSGHVDRVKVYPTSNNKLFVVSAGPAAPNPMALLNSEKMNAFLRDMASSFHFVILDAPPVLPTAEARIVGSKADGVVLVVRAGVTPRHVLRRVCAVLDDSGANVLGAVLNGADSKHRDYSYYHYYHQSLEG